MTTTALQRSATLHAGAPPRLESRRRGASSAARAFTLIELLVVMGIIVLLIALALPAFNFITGSRSGEAAGNQIGAALGIARAQAIGVQETKGVAIYHDAATDKTVAALVELRQTPFDAWTAGTAAAPINYTLGQYVTYSGDVYVCVDTYTDSAGTIKPNTGGDFWREMPSLKSFINATATFIELQQSKEFVVLPTGVECRAVGNEVNYPVPSAAVSATNFAHRYFNPVVVLFDANGQITTQSYFVALEGLLGYQTNFSYAVPQPILDTASKPLPYGAGKSSVTTVSSQIGLVLFNAENFKNAAGTTAASQANWLDENGTPLMINRYNGTLVRGE